MPPPLPSSPATGRTPTQPKGTASKPSTITRRPGSAASVKRPPSVASSKAGMPRVQQNGITSRATARKDRGSSDKENSGGSKVEIRPSRRQSSASVATREKPPAKDGTAQRNAKEVEGLKDYVSSNFVLSFMETVARKGTRTWWFEQQLGDCLGRGAFGAVYRALNWSTGETVAIKQISLTSISTSNPNASGGQPGLRAADLTAIMQEIDLLKNLNHPNIVKYHGFVRSTESLYIILEYCENGSLYNILKGFGKFPENLVSLYTAQTLQGLLFLHEQGVIHRDIKGANILTTKEGLVKLADFGVATKQQGLSDGSSVVGTPYWMAPEVIELSGASTASDIWSLGCTVIELLDGKPPYHKFAPMPALFRIVNDDHPPIPEGVSPLVRDFLMQCFQKDPNLRVSAKKLLRHPWILSGRRGEAKQQPVKHEEAVKTVEEWNQMLKSSPKGEQQGGSRRSSARPGSRPVSRNDGAGKTKLETPGVGARSVFQLGPRKDRDAKVYASPDDDDKRNNWDSDFEGLATSFNALQLPEHRRPQDNFAGLFTAEKLKRYATDSIPDLDGKIEQWDEEFPDGELTVRSPLQLTRGDAVETVRPFYPTRTTSDEIKHKPPSSLASRRPPSGGERRSSRESQPKTQILRPTANGKSGPGAKAKQAPTAAAAAKKNVHISATANKDRFRESEEDEDYSDLVPTDEDAFQRKLAGFSPSRAYNPRDIRHMGVGVGGSVRRRTHTPTNLVHDAAAMRRTRSSLEIQKYAEDEEDEDFGDLMFEELHPVKQRSPQSASTASVGSGESENGTLKMSGSATWLADDEEEDEEDDPFAALEEELDEVDLEMNVARDKHARLCTLVEGLVSDLKLSQREDVLAEIVDQLLQVLIESPDVKTVIVASHGMLPLLEILDTCTRPNTILSLLRIVNAIIGENVEVQENLCFVGGIPIVTKFAHKKFSSEIRLEAASFVRMMYQTSTLTLQMFVSCGGLNVLVEFLEEDYDTDAGRELVLLGVNGVWSVFELQGPTPKNDFCRIFSRSSVLYPLSLVLNKILEEDEEWARVFEGRIVNIFLLFSQAENHVKETVAERMVLKPVLKDLRRMSPVHQITMLKFIKNLSMLATTLDALQNSNAIEVLIDLLGAAMKEKATHFRELSNQVLNTMYNLCRLSKSRQEDAALNGVVPLLQKVVQTERPLKEFALPILCDMAHSGKVGRKVLWQNKGLQFYSSLLADQYWAVTALDAILTWVGEETHKVEETLLATPAFVEGILQCFSESKGDAFENFLEPLQKLVRVSAQISIALGGRREFFERCKGKLVKAKKPLVRLNLLKILRGICVVDEEKGGLIGRYGLFDSIQELALTDQAILVREMAKELVNLADQTAVAGGSAAAAARYAGLRRSSSSIMTPPPLSSTAGSSMPPTPTDRNGSRIGFFETGMEMARSRPTAASSPFRPVSRDAGSGSSATSGQFNTASTSLSSAAAPAKSARMPPPRSSMANLRSAGSRMSLAPSTGSNASRLSLATTLVDERSGSGGGGRDSTPTHVPPSAGTRSSVLAANARRRRQTSGAEQLGRH